MVAARSWQILSSLVFFSAFHIILLSKTAKNKESGKLLWVNINSGCTIARSISSFVHNWHNSQQISTPSNGRRKTCRKIFLHFPTILFFSHCLLRLLPLPPYLYHKSLQIY